MNSVDKNMFLKVRDHSVSREEFDLLYDAEFDMLVTSPKPDASELGRYYDSSDYISHTDSKRSLFEKTYHFIKAIALNKKVKLIDKIHGAKGTLLDIGAGTGDFLAKAKDKGWQVSGSEPNEGARRAASRKGLDLNNDTATFETGSFDIITMWHVLEHVADLNGQIVELRRLLKSNGTILIAVPNFKSFDAAHYGEFWAAYDVPRHLWHFSRTSIDKLFKKHGFILVDVLPMTFDAFYVSLLSEKYRTKKMNPLRAFFIGLQSNYKARISGNYSSQIYVLKTK